MRSRQTSAAAPGGRSMSTWSSRPHASTVIVAPASSPAPSSMRAAPRRPSPPHATRRTRRVTSCSTCSSAAFGGGAAGAVAHRVAPGGRSRARLRLRGSIGVGVARGSSPSTTSWQARCRSCAACPGRPGSPGHRASPALPAGTRAGFRPAAGWAAAAGPPARGRSASTCAKPWKPAAFLVRGAVGRAGVAGEAGVLEGETGGVVTSPHRESPAPGCASRSRDAKLIPGRGCPSALLKSWIQVPHHNVSSSTC